MFAPLTILQVWTDSRSRLLRELLSSMEIIKVFTYELPFLKREYKPVFRLPQGYGLFDGRKWSAFARSSSYEQRTKLLHLVYL